MVLYTDIDAYIYTEKKTKTKTKKHLRAIMMLKNNNIKWNTTDSRMAGITEGNQRLIFLCYHFNLTIVKSIHN